MLFYGECKFSPILYDCYKLGANFIVEPIMLEYNKNRGSGENHYNLLSTGDAFSDKNAIQKTFNTLLSWIDSTFNKIDNTYSSISGGIAGILKGFSEKQFPKFLHAFEKLSRGVLVAGITIDLLISAYTNYHDDALTTSQKWIRFGLDARYISIKSGIFYGLGNIAVEIAVSASCYAAGFAVSTFLIDDLFGR